MVIIPFRSRAECPNITLCSSGSSGETKSCIEAQVCLKKANISLSQPSTVMSTDNANQESESAIKSFLSWLGKVFNNSVYLTYAILVITLIVGAAIFSFACIVSVLPRRVRDNR